MTSLRRGATAAYRWLTIVFFVGVVVQFFLAGLGVFGMDVASNLDDQSSLDPHRMLGNVLIAIALGLAVLILVARPTRRVALPYLVLLVLSILQSVFANAGGEVLGGLHGLTAIAILGLSGSLAHRAFRREVTAR
jgi:hypothetical protein